MATRRPPEDPVQPLTPAQDEMLKKHLYIATRVTEHYTKKYPRGLKPREVFSEANHGLIAGVLAANPADAGLESYLWEYAKGAVLSLIRKKAKDRARTAEEPVELVLEHMQDGASTAMSDFAATFRDPGDPWDSREQSIAHLHRAAEEGAAALAMGSAGAVWYMRGQDGYAQRAEDVRTSKALHDEVAELSPVHGAVVDLRYFQQRKLEDVAAATGLSLPTVNRRLEQAIPLLRARLVAKGIKGPPEKP
jgi:RNA polymerase sigma factor (sigma-70 family)